MAVDVGATNLRVALVSTEGIIADKIVLRTPREGDELVVANAIRSAIAELLDRSSTKMNNIVGIGVGSIGPLDIRTGTVINAPNVPIKRMELLKPLRKWFGVPVYVVNDCVAAVWGEVNFGAGRSYRNVVYITISTGIGAGVVVDGNLLLGKDGNAHEVGHLVLDYESDVECGCGGYGHWEGLASGSNLPKFMKYLVTRKRPELLRLFSGSNILNKILNETLTPEELFRLAREGNELALEIVDELGKIHAAGIASVINAYDPELLTLGGSIVLNNKDLLLKFINKYVDKYLINRKPKIIVTPLGHDAVLLGAAAIVLNTPENLRRLQR